MYNVMALVLVLVLVLVHRLVGRSICIRTWLW